MFDIHYAGGTSCPIFPDPLIYLRVCLQQRVLQPIIPSPHPLHATLTCVLFPTIIALTPFVLQNLLSPIVLNLAGCVFIVYLLLSLGGYQGCNPDYSGT